jgi:2,3,4,5-tetrahydropyridine-2-carboxylate N-succinyltransferase
MRDLEVFYGRDDVAVLSDPMWATAHEALLQALESGGVRAAVLGADGVWRANAWVKRAILLGFRGTELEAVDGAVGFFDKSAYPVRRFGAADRVRLVPGGSAVRRGAYVAPGVVVMPPAYVNVGAYVGSGTMVDSHALVGSCAQVGKGVHLSAGAQIGGVLEPAGMAPVVVEDGAFVGALCGVFEGVVVRERAVLAAGVVLTAGTVIYDLVNGCERRGEVPAGAVVVSGVRKAKGVYAEELGVGLAAAVVVKYRDEKTDVATALEGALR